MRSLALAALLAALLATSGCSQLMAGLRRDLDDGDTASQEPPVVGGRYAERGFLADEMPEAGPGAGRYAALGHSDRSPASAGSDGRVDGNSWVSPDRADANRRDLYRGQSDDSDPAAPAYSNTPVMEPQTKRLYKNGSRATRADFVDETPNEGSLWASDGQTNYYFTKNKIRGVGDILTIAIEDALVRDVALEVRRGLTPRERDVELTLAQARIRAKYLGLEDPDAKKDPNAVASSAAAPARTNTPRIKNPSGDQEEIEMPQAGMTDVDLTRTLELKAGDTMLAEIVERYPNGNYKIRGTKKVPYKNGAPRMLTLVGIARSADISEEDIIQSGKLYEYKLEAVR